MCEDVGVTGAEALGREGPHALPPRRDARVVVVDKRDGPLWGQPHESGSPALHQVDMLRSRSDGSRHQVDMLISRSDGSRHQVRSGSDGSIRATP